MRVTDFTAFSLAQDALRVMFDPNPPYLWWREGPGSYANGPYWGCFIVIKSIKQSDGGVKEITIFRKWVGDSSGTRYYKGCYVQIKRPSQDTEWLSFDQIRVDGGLNGNVSF